MTVICIFLILPGELPSLEVNNQQCKTSLRGAISRRLTRIEFVGVVSLFGKGLLSASAAQLQKIVKSTRYSNGLGRTWRVRESSAWPSAYFHSTSLMQVRRSWLSSVRQNRARRGCSGVVCRRFRRRISACCSTALQALLPVGISKRCA